MAGTVTSQLTNVTLAESADSANWDDIGGGQGSAQATDVPLEGSATRGRLVSNKTAGFSFDNTTGIDLSAEGTHVGFWVTVLQPSAITSIDLLLGGASTPQTSPYENWEIFGAASRTYPVAGGWQKIWLDVSSQADSTTGTVNWASIRQYGAEFVMASVAGNFYNTHLDRIDYTTGGLLVDSGTAGSPATFADFVSAEGSNAYGVVYEKNGVLFCLAGLTIGDATATVFDDSDTVISFADQIYSKDGFLRLAVDLQNASTDVDLTGVTLLSGGDTRKGAFAVEGTSGSCDLSGCSLQRLRRVLLTGGATLSSTTLVSCGQVDPVESDYGGYMTLDGTADYVKTTTSLGLSSASGDIDLIMCLRSDDWTAQEDYFDASDGTANNANFNAFLSGAGNLSVTIGDTTAQTTWSITGGPSLAKNLSTAVGNSLWLRFKYDHSAGQVFFYCSADAIDTPPEDVQWTQDGNPTGTARSIAVANLQPLIIGAFGSGTTPFDGRVYYTELWKGGFREPGADHGELVCVADWRKGPNFVSDTRADDFDSSITWSGVSSPTYTQGGDETTAATLAGCTVADSTSYAALRWDVNTDPAGELDDMAFQMGATGHAIELGPSCPSTIGLNGQTYVGYAATDGSGGDEVIYNNSGKAVTINVGSGGDTPTVRNGTSASTTVNNTVTYTFTNLKNHSEVTLLQGASELLHIEDVAVIPREASYTYNYTGDASATLLVEHPNYVQYVAEVELGNSDASLRVEQEGDRIYDNPPGGNPGYDGLVAWYELDEAGSPTTWADSHIYGYDLGKEGSPLSSDGWVGNGALELATSGALTGIALPSVTGDITVCGWARDAGSDGETVRGLGQYGSSFKNFYMWGAWGRWNLRMRNASAATFDVQTPVISNITEWHFVVGRREGGDASVWVDGEESATGVFSGSYPDVSEPFAIGKAAGAYSTPGGEVDNWCLYNRALSDDEIRYLYNYGEGREFSDL